ncbi:Nmad5 family putative nucleotide modification protein [Xanthobacter aminoxidans]|uniref:Nmad5 family putative nucleotide modification protein n=1 Tax=Xanthobacter aminoxidans TaxID=186280 RepID=UPI002022C5E3|nr:Nmad5 family putative nucleotide modification protein [Xanthobacter aminoxidans]MCL8385528.1 Nmad5 family putative nucleotide modification protein [Xanthobacter aminoxidans]
MSKSIPLTNMMRDRFITDLLGHRYADEIAGLESEAAALALAVYNDIYKPAQRAAMADLPAGWMAEVSNFAIQFGDSNGYTHLSFDGVHGYRGEWSALRKKSEAKPIAMRVAHKHTTGCAKVYAPEHRFTATFRSIEERRKDLAKRVQESRTQIKAVVYSVSSTKMLRERWPEASAFVTRLERIVPPRLPSVPLSSLNASLGLPPTEVRP